MKKNINNKFKVILLTTILTVLFAIAPSGAFAASVFLESSKNTLSVGDTAIISVKINSDGAVLNTVEGDIKLLSTKGGNLAVQEFSLANSSFGLWPRTPSLSSDGSTITFVGGVPGGFSIEGATLFKIIVEAKKEGTIEVSPKDMSVYVNDGKGTKIPVQVQGLTINVTSRKTGVPVNNEWQNLVSQDTIPPEDFLIILGQDNSIFSGKKFAFFSAVDNQSGIDHYDVSENGAPAVRSGSTYVMQDQDGEVSLNVVAYDKAGNKKSSVYRPTQEKEGINWIFVIAVILVIVVIRMIYKKSKRNNSINQINGSGDIQK